MPKATVALFGVKLRPQIPLTKGRQINVPAESMLTFRLEQPIRLR